MDKEPKNRGRVGEEVEILPDEVVGVPEEAPGTGRKGAGDAEWMSMVDGDPALFIEVEGSE